MEKLLAIKEAAHVMNVHPRTVNRMINRGELPAVKVAGRWRIKPEAVKALVEGSEGNDKH